MANICERCKEEKGGKMNICERCKEEKEVKYYRGNLVCEDCYKKLKIYYDELNRRNAEERAKEMMETKVYDMQSCEVKDEDCWEPDPETQIWI